ncbi:MAG: hypothetical protein OXC18_16325 [Desulfurellaceae bacterium]|nr:hypothetical protein [Desulfurellaceae bacterium]
MEPESDITALSHGQLVALVYDLRRQLAARDREIARLQKARAEKPASDAEDHAQEAVPPPGTQAALMAQLEQIYPET